MAEINKKLTKRIISNKYSNDVLSKNFSKLSKSENPVNADKIKEIHDNVFYTMPKIGKLSHKKLIEQSYNHINYNYNQLLERDNKKLTKKLSGKEAELISLDNPTANEHPVYEDGAILVAGEGGQIFQDNDIKYIMQEGRKRAFDNNTIFLTAKKALGIPLDDLDGRYYVTIDELNGIPDGPVIGVSPDFHFKGTELMVDLPDILGTAAYYDVEFECLGNEISDYVGALTDSMLDLDINTLQFYLGNESCIMKYIKDDYTNDEEGPTSIETVIPRGEKQLIRILRRTDLSNDMIPSDINSYYQDDIPINIEYNGNDIDGYIKNWGPHGDYESIVYAEGRIMSQEIGNEHIANSLLLLGDIQDTSQKLLNGLPTNTTGVWGDSDIHIIDDPNYSGQKLSNFGTPMIYNTPGYYGALNQSAGLQSDIFDDPGNIYYLRKSSGYRLYGQPIIRYNNRWNVLVNTYKKNSTRYVEFMDLGGHDIWKKHRPKVEDAIGMVMNRDTLNMEWDTLHRSRIEFIGLQEFKTNKQSRSDNIFNPVNGSNYEINQYNSLY